MKDNKKVILMSLLSFILVFSNIIASSTVTIFGLTINARVLIFPFAFLCISSLTELYGLKSGIKSVIFALIIEVLYFLLSTLICNLPINSDILPKLLTPVSTKSIMHPQIKFMLSTFISLCVSGFINACFYDFSKRYIPRFISISLSLLIALIIESVIFITISTPLINAHNLAKSMINEYTFKFILAFIMVPIFTLLTRTKKA